MLDWTHADSPYVKALTALEAVSRKLLERELRDEDYMGPSVWQGLGAIGGCIRAAWAADRRRRAAR